MSVDLVDLLLVSCQEVVDKRAQQPLQLALTLKDFCPSQMPHPDGHSEHFSKAFRGWIVVSKQSTLGDLPDPTKISAMAKVDGFV